MVKSFATTRVTAPLKEPEDEKVLMVLPPMESAVDDLSLHNPLKRAERLSTGWFGVIMEFEGVVMEDTYEAHTQAWLKVAAEFGFPRPLGQVFRRMKGVRDEVVVTRVLNWTQNMTTARQIAKRKMAVYEELLGGRQPAEMLEARPFLETLRKYQIPVALSCAMPEARVKEHLKRFNLGDYFDAVVTAEDSGAPEVEFYYSYASQQIQRPPIRCIVFGESNQSVEAAHELGMKCVVVTGNKPVYDFVGADLVARNLSQINFFNLKRLFGAEDLVEPRMPGEDGRSPEDDIVDDPELDDFEFDSGYQKGAFFSGR